jgi:hypothetical protein
MSVVSVRSARISEHEALEALQRRASLQNPMDREALLANPHAIALPVQQLVEGRVFVAEQEGRLMGFSAVIPRHDGDMELDAIPGIGLLMKKPM